MTHVIALRRKEPSGLHLWIKPEAQVAELVAMSQPGDTMHKLPQELAEAPDCAQLMDLCAEQVVAGDCITV